MIVKNLYKSSLRIALDLDDTIFDWRGEFEKKFPHLNWEDDQGISNLVYSIRQDKQFWENLPLLERPDFEPSIYATKRINSKIYTRNNLIKYDLPIKPIYQIYSQEDNKARIIKGRCDVLIDDSIFNVLQAIQAGLPAIVITRPHNSEEANLPRITSLSYDEIMEVYEKYYKDDFNRYKIRSY